MPFTFAHPAIVLPLLNKRLKLFSATGLIIGSIIPDFESFIRLDEHKLYSHTWPGIFWFDLPLAIIVAYIFHNIVRDPLIDNLPRSLENKFKNYEGLNWNSFFKKHFLKIIVSMLIGIVLHLLWDAFTHLNLANPDAVDSQIYIGQYRLFKVLQDTNSAIGLIVVIAYIILMPGKEVKEAPVEKMIFVIKRTKPKYSKLKYWAVVCNVAVVTVFLAMELLTRHITIVLFIDINITGVLLGFVVAGMLQRAVAERS